MNFAIDVCYRPITSSTEEEKIKHDLYAMEFDLMNNSRQITGMIESIIANSMLYKLNIKIEYVNVYCPTQELAEVLNNYYSASNTLSVNIYCTCSD